MENYAAYFSQAIKAFRLEHRLTQKAFAEQLGYSEKTVSKWECGAAIPDIATLLRLGKVMQMSMETMFSDRKNYYLGIDGGGTKTDLVLADENGETVRSLKTECCNPMDVGFSAATRVLKDAIYEICKEIPLASIYTFAGVAGATVADMPKRFEEFFGEFGFADVECDSDNRNIIAAGLGAQDGISVILGTGVCVYRQKNLTHKRIGGWGYLIDDGGSGYNLGRDALHAYFCAEDGSGERTLLSEEIDKMHPGGSVELMQYIYEGRKKAIASFASTVFAAIAQGDAVAERILRRNMSEAAHLIETAGKEFGDDPVLVVVAGGLTNQPLVLTYLQEALNDAKRYHFRVLAKAPVCGAVALAQALRKER